MGLAIVEVGIWAATSGFLQISTARIQQLQTHSSFSFWYRISTLVPNPISRRLHHHFPTFVFSFQGEQAAEYPFLCYEPLKEGIYSVVYDSSLSQLQAFSICMALAESRKMSEITLDRSQKLL